jgi:hypothetical protein
MNPQKLVERIGNFWGYGNLESPIWLVGMEEGFRSTHDSEADKKMLERQFSLPTVNGMFDARRPINHSLSDLTNLSPFLPSAGPRPQSTWKFPIMLYLFLRNGKYPSEDEILNFQRFVLADGEKNEMATLELSPLPSPDINSWLFGDIAGFETRKSYERSYQKERSKGLRDLVQKYSSTLKLVIFYSANKKTHLPIWAEAIGKMPNELTEITHQLYFEKINKTSICIIPQNHRGSMSPDRLYEYAKKIKGEINI